MSPYTAGGAATAYAHYADGRQQLIRTWTAENPDAAPDSNARAALERTLDGYDSQHNPTRPGADMQLNLTAWVPAAKDRVEWDSENSGTHYTGTIAAAYTGSAEVHVLTADGTPAAGSPTPMRVQNRHLTLIREGAAQ